MMFTKKVRHVHIYGIKCIQHEKSISVFEGVCALAKGSTNSLCTFPRLHSDSFPSLVPVQPQGQCPVYGDLLKIRKLQREHIP